MIFPVEWEKGVLIDTCLPFRLRSAPKLFNNMADLLAWILVDQGVSYPIHYLDDFLTVGPPSSADCGHNLHITQVCQALGVPLASEKVAGPSTNLEFLGIPLDTVRMEAPLPTDKLARVRQAIGDWLGRKNATKREILSLVGLLQHAAKVVHPGRTFVRRMYSAAARVQQLDYFTRLNQEFRSDLHWWHTFLQEWNRVSFLHSSRLASPDAVLQTDASGTWGYGAVFHTQWFQGQWPKEWSRVPIMVKELAPIVLACAAWGPSLTRKTVLFQCDNTGVVSCRAKGHLQGESCNAPTKMPMVLCSALQYHCHFRTHHWGANNAADHLSINNVQSFFLSTPQASLLPTPLPPELLEIAMGSNLDLTSPAFKHLFNFTTTRVWPHQPTGHIRLARNDISHFAP